MSQVKDAVDALARSVEAENTVIDSAISVITGIPGVVQAAVQKALEDANVDAQAATDAATAANAAVTAETQKLKDALTANTPTPTP